MTALRFNPELFVLPQADGYQLGLPLEGRWLTVNASLLRLLQQAAAGDFSGLARHQELLDELVAARVLLRPEDQPATPPGPRDVDVYAPAALCVIPSFACNLRCSYCYSNAGPGGGPRLSPKAALRAVDEIVRRAHEQKRPRVALTFQGGGEPFLEQNLPLVQAATAHFRTQANSLALRSSVSGTTNGVLPESTLAWMAAHLDFLTVSLDGPPEVQNRQRPTAAGSGSFEHVLRTIRFLDRAGFRYGLRATVTRESVSRMVEIVNCLASISSCRKLHFEPLFECGRCATTREAAPAKEVFVEQYRAASAAAAAVGMELYNAGASLAGVGPYFCGALGWNCILTPDGHISTCVEVARSDDPMAGVFFIGRYVEGEDRFEFWWDRIKKLRDRRVERMAECQDCFLKWNCSGYCPRKTTTLTGSFYTVAGERCFINREIAKAVIGSRR